MEHFPALPKPPRRVPKTGSSTLQSTLALKRAMLFRENIIPQCALWRFGALVETTSVRMPATNASMPLLPAWLRLLGVLVEHFAIQRPGQCNCLPTEERYPRGADLSPRRTLAAAHPSFIDSDAEPWVDVHPSCASFGGLA